MIDFWAIKVKLKKEKWDLKGPVQGPHTNGHEECFFFRMLMHKLLMHKHKLQKKRKNVIAT